MIGTLFAIGTLTLSLIVAAKILRACIRKYMLVYHTKDKVKAKRTGVRFASSILFLITGTLLFGFMSATIFGGDVFHTSSAYTVSMYLFGMNTISVIWILEQILDNERGHL